MMQRSQGKQVLFTIEAYSAHARRPLYSFCPAQIGAAAARRTGFGCGGGALIVTT